MAKPPSTAKQTALKLVAALVMLGLAAMAFSSFLRQQRGQGDNIFFYDLSEQKLFVGPRTAVPPIKGINNDELDGMRAVVIAPAGKETDKASRKIAYLEKYSPEFKQQIESMRRGETTGEGQGQITKGQGRAHTFVRRLTDTEWHSLNSEEALKIMGDWQVPGPDGKLPSVCLP